MKDKDSNNVTLKDKIQLNYSPDTSLLLCLGGIEERPASTPVILNPEQSLPDSASYQEEQKFETQNLPFDESWNCNILPQNNVPFSFDMNNLNMMPLPDFSNQNFNPMLPLDSNINNMPNVPNNFNMNNFPIFPNFLTPMGMNTVDDMNMGMNMMPVNIGQNFNGPNFQYVRTPTEVCTNIYLNKGSAKLSEAEDWTPNPHRLLDILIDLEKLNEIICKLKDECELPNAKPNLKRERNRLASKACRLKKKATHETNKIKLEGLEMEFKLLVYALHFMSWEVISFVSFPQNSGDNLSSKLKDIQAKYLNGIKVAGDSDNFVKNVLERTKSHENSYNIAEPIIPV